MSGSKCYALLKWYAVLAAGALLGACVSAPESPAVVEPVRDGADRAEIAAVTPTKVIDLNSRVENPDSVVSCRDMLKQGSNVIVRTCMSRIDWQRFERQQANEARAIVRMMQGGAYR